MSKSPEQLILEFELRQESVRQAEAVIAKAAGVTRSRCDKPLGYLVTFFNHRTDVPDSAALIKMLPEVDCRLAAMGLHEPISLRGLAGKWWLAHVDMAYDDPRMESGCGMVRKVASSEDLIEQYRGYYREVIAGPFDRMEDVK